MQIHIQNIYGHFKYQGHRVKIKGHRSKKRVYVSLSQVICLRLKGSLA